jgi:hypothetical protein
VVSKILYLRQQYHFGAGRIADYLKRFHQVTIARSSVHRILVKHDMRRLPANQKYQPHRKRWKRYEKPKPGHRLQMDVKFLERIPGTRKPLYQFTAIDDCTRIRILKVYDHAISAARSNFSTRSGAGSRSGSTLFRPITGQSSSYSFTGTPKRWILNTSTSARGRRG